MYSSAVIESKGEIEEVDLGWNNMHCTMRLGCIYAEEARASNIPLSERGTRVTHMQKVVLLLVAFWNGEELLIFQTGQSVIFPPWGASFITENCVLV